MAFSSIEFIFMFLPIFLFVFYIVPLRIKPFCLLLGSLVFYWLSVKNVWAFLLPVIGVLLALSSKAHPKALL